MTRFVLVSIVVLMASCAQKAVRTPEVQPSGVQTTGVQPPGKNTVHVIIQPDSSVDDLTITIRPWRLTIMDQPEMTVVLIGGEKLVGEWEVNNTNPKKTSDDCPAFTPGRMRGAGQINLAPVAELSKEPVICKYTIVLRPADGSAPIAIDPEYRIGPH